MPKCVCIERLNMWALNAQMRGRWTLERMGVERLNVWALDPRMHTQVTWVNPLKVCNGSHIRMCLRHIIKGARQGCIRRGTLWARKMVNVRIQ